VKQIAMARSHHRKKHKEHLRQYQHEHDSVAQKAKGNKAANVFTVVGAVAGLALGYFSSDRSTVWSILVALAGAAAGYFFGRSLDRQSNKQH